jgi:hypothetical protein
MQADVQGHVIVTTRRRGFRQIGRAIELDVVNMETAICILQSRVPSLQAADAKSVAELLGCLPLVLEQATAYLDRTQISPADYLELLATRQSTMFAAMADQVCARSVFTVWELSLYRIGAESPAALQILDICAYLAPEPVPLDLLTSHPDRVSPPLTFVAADLLQFNDAIATIVGYSMAQRSESGLQLHRLVQAALRARHAELAS